MNFLAFLLLALPACSPAAQSTPQAPQADQTKPQQAPPLPGPGQPGFDPVRFRAQILQQTQNGKQQRQIEKEQLQKDREQRQADAFDRETQRRAERQQTDQTRREALTQAADQIHRAQTIHPGIVLTAPGETAPQPAQPQPAAPPHAPRHITLPGIDISSDPDDHDTDPEAPASPTRQASPESQPTLDPRHLQASSFGDRLDLTPAWLFARGTGPHNQDPTFDDSHWTSIDARQPLVTTGEFNLNEIWYRAHITLPADSRDLALTLTRIGGSYRVFVNGRDIGGRGTMRDRGDFLVAGSSTFAIPPDVLSAAHGQLTIALHLFVGSVDRLSFTLQDGISPRSAVYLGPATLLARDEITYREAHRTESTAVLTLWAVLLLIALALAVLVPGVPAYRLLAVIAGAHLFGNLLLDYRNMNQLAEASLPIWIITPFTTAAAIAGLEFCRIAGHFPRRRWVSLLEAFYLLAVFSLYPAAAGAFSLALYAILVYTAYALVAVADLTFIVLGARRRHQDAQILLAATSIYTVYLLWWLVIRFLHPSLIPASFAHNFITRFDPEAVANLFVALGLFVLLVTRTLRIVRERATIATEIDAARTMQQLLLGRSPKSTPGFAVETVYLPAGEVGGDFFLLAPTPAGALIALVGDVSGKGLLAAMRVSMIFGILRREPSFNPAEILAGLNEALLTQGEMGFTTACCLHIEPSGRYTLANAGHIPPYVMGVEMVLPPALPLGLAPDQIYELTHGTLAPHERMVLLSDGVPEARTEKGELYGFDRLAPLTLRPAQEIANTAKLFGAKDPQPDDITVLTIACLPAPDGPTALPPPAPPPPRPALS